MSAACRRTHSRQHHPETESLSSLREAAPGNFESPAHRHLVHRSIRQLLAARIEPRPKEGTAPELGPLDILADCLRCVEVQTDGSALVSLLVQANCRLVAVLVKV